MGRWDAAVALGFRSRGIRGKAVAFVLLAAIGVSVCSHCVVYSAGNSLQVEAVDLVRIAKEHDLDAEAKGEEGSPGKGKVYWVYEGGEEEDITGKTTQHEFCDAVGAPKPVKLRAEANQGSCFLRWEGDLDGTVPEQELLMDDRKHVIAVFATGGACPLDSSGQDEGNELGKDVADERTSSTGPAGFTGSGKTDFETSATDVEITSPITRFNFAYEDDTKILRAAFSGDATDLRGQTVAVELSYINDVNFEIGTIGRSSTHIPAVQTGGLRLKASVLWDNPAPGRYRVTARAYISSGDGALGEAGTAEATQTFYVLRYGEYALPLSAGESNTRFFLLGEGEDALPKCLRGQILAEKLSLRMSVINLGSTLLDKNADDIMSHYLSFRTKYMELFRSYELPERLTSILFNIELPDGTPTIPRGGVVKYRALESPSIAYVFLRDDYVFNFTGDATDRTAQGLGIGRAFEMRVRFPEYAADAIFLENQLDMYPPEYKWAYGGEGETADGCAPIGGQRVSVPPTVDDEGDKLYFSIDHNRRSTLYDHDMKLDKTEQLYQPRGLSELFASPALATHTDGTKVVYLLSSKGKLYCIEPLVKRDALWLIDLVEAQDVNTQLSPGVTRIETAAGVKMLLLLATKSGAFAVEIPDAAETKPESADVWPISDDPIARPLVSIRREDGKELAVWFVTDKHELKRASSNDGRNWSYPAKLIDERVSTGLVLDSHGNVFYGKDDGNIAWSDFDHTDEGRGNKKIGDNKVIDIDIDDDILYATTAGGHLVRWNLSDLTNDYITKDIEGAAGESDWCVAVYKTDKAEAAFVASAQAGCLRGYTVDNHKAPKKLVDLYIRLFTVRQELAEHPETPFRLDVDDKGMLSELIKPVIYDANASYARLFLGSGDGYLHAFDLTASAIPGAYHDGTD